MLIMSFRMPTRIIGLSTLLVCVIALTAHSKPVVTSKSSRKSDTAPDPLSVKFAKARGELLTGRCEKAHRLFRELASQHTGSSKLAGYASLYLAVCRMTNPESQDPLPRYREFVELAGHGLPSTERLFFDTLFYCVATGTSGSEQFASLDVRVGVQPQPSFRADIKSLVSQLKKSRADFARTKSVEHKIVLASWLLLFGELGVHRKDAGLYSNAYDAIADGLKLSDELDPENIEVKKLLESKRLVAMRYDLVTLRRQQLQAKQQVARQEELKRLSQLRRLAREYRSILQEVAETQVRLQSGDILAASQANRQVIDRMSNILSIAGERRDYYLFRDEPNINGKDTDFDTLHVAPQPYSRSVLAYWKGLQGVLSAQAAVKAKGVIDEAAATDALKWANESLPKDEGDQPDLAEGRDGANVLANLARGMVFDARGVRKTSGRLFDLAAHHEAQPEFAKAIAAFKRAKQLLATAEAGNGPVARQIDRQLAMHSTGPEQILDIARLVQSGRVRAAARTCRQTLARRIDPSLILATLEVDLRTGRGTEEILADLEMARKSGALGPQDLRARLLESKIRLGDAWKQLEAIGAARLDENERAKLLKTADDQIASLKATAKLENINETDLAELNCYQAYSVALRSVLKPPAEKANDELLRVFVSAKNAGVVLTKSVAAEKRIDVAVRLRESLVCCRLAMGFLAIHALPEYRRESQLAFGAAFDEQARLPFAPVGSGLAGSQALNAILSRSDQQDKKLAHSEKRLRQTMAWATDAILALHFGDAQAAAGRMDVALEAGRNHLRGRTDGVSVDAARLLDNADLTDSRQSMLDRLELVNVRCQIAAGRSEKALAGSLRPLLPAPLNTKSDAELIAGLNDSLLGAAGKAIVNPMRGYALAAALEAFVETLPPGASPQRMLILKHLRVVLNSVTKQLKAEDQQKKFRWLTNTVAAFQLRLSSPQYFLIRGQAHEQASRLDDATMEYESGLKKFPASMKLWSAMLRLDLEKLLRTPTDKLQQADVKQFLVRLEIAGREKHLTPFQQSVFLAKLKQHRQQPPATPPAGTKSEKETKNN
jgi:hypothetical protein